MNLTRRLRDSLKPNIPLDVSEDLKDAIKILIHSGAPINKLLLFGSLNNGSWNRENSDIDLSVIFEDDENYSFLNKKIVGYISDEEAWPIMGETSERVRLRDLIRNSSLKFREKYELHMVTLSDLKLMKDKAFVKNMLDGRFLYC